MSKKKNGLHYCDEANEAFPYPHALLDSTARSFDCRFYLRKSDTKQAFAREGGLSPGSFFNQSILPRKKGPDGESRPSIGNASRLEEQVRGQYHAADPSPELFGLKERRIGRNRVPWSCQRCGDSSIAENVSIA